MSRVLLIQVDGKMDNLALMKLAGYHCNKGDDVRVLKRPKSMKELGDISVYNDVYVSCIFEDNASFANQICAISGGKNIHVGGTGVNIKSELPYEIEHVMPNYDAFGCDHSVGFTSRGCIRNCGFCVVPEKEGHRVRPVADIYEFWDTRHKKIVIMDNNILALSDHFHKITDQLLEEKLFVDFNSGLDIRLINDDNAIALSTLRRKRYTFAWDYIGDENAVMNGLEILKNHGIRESRFYVLVGYDSTWEEDMYRLQKLKELKQIAYCMRYKTVKKDKNYAMMASWVNMPWAFFKYTFDEFTSRKRAKDYKKERVNRDQI